jgi:hypothetical protein
MVLGHVDLFLYGFLSGYIFSKSKYYVANLLKDADLEDWFDAMQKELSFDKVFSGV